MTLIYSHFIVLLSLCILLYVPFIFMHGLFVLFSIIGLTFYVSVYSCNGVGMPY